MTFRTNYHKHTRKKAKYNNRSQEYNGRRYDSIKEAQYAEELDWRIKAGEIKEWIPQFKIELKVNGYRIANYYVDFKVIRSDDSIEFHEVKGFETEVWKMKWKILEATVNEVEPGAELIVIK